MSDQHTQPADGGPPPYLANPGQAMPRTRGLRRSAALAIRRQLNTYTGGHGGQLTDTTSRTTLQVVEDAAVLALLDGHTPEAVRAATERAVTLSQQPDPVRVERLT